jgi:hypothetical protein
MFVLISLFDNCLYCLDLRFRLPLGYIQTVLTLTNKNRPQYTETPFLFVSFLCFTQNYDTWRLYLPNILITIPFIHRRVIDIIKYGSLLQQSEHICDTDIRSPHFL